MSGPNAISAVSRRDLDTLADHPGFHPAVTLYGLSDGVEATQIYGGVAPAGCLTPSGEVWFPSNRGPVRIMPLEAPPELLPKVVLEQVLVDGREPPVSGHLVVPPGEGRLQISYAAVRLRSQERIRFPYMLEGFDHDWTEALAAARGVLHQSAIGRLPLSRPGVRNEHAGKRHRSRSGHPVAPSFLPHPLVLRPLWGDCFWAEYWPPGGCACARCTRGFGPCLRNATAWRAKCTIPSSRGAPASRPCWRRWWWWSGMKAGRAGSCSTAPAPRCALRWMRRGGRSGICGRAGRSTPWEAPSGGRPQGPRSAPCWTGWRSRPVMLPACQSAVRPPDGRWLWTPRWSTIF